MKSMTGYGFAEHQSEKARISVELKSYNNRYLDIGVSLPATLSPLEPRARDYLAKRISRGRVELTARVVEYEEELSIVLDKRAARSYAKVLRDLAETAGIDEGVQLIHLLMMEGIVKSDGLLRVERTTDVELFWGLLEPQLEKAFGDFERSRIAEGKSTEEDILANLARVEHSLETIKGYSGELEAIIKGNLRERFAELLGNSYDESRLLAETAVLLVKSTIGEEVQRLESHLASFRSVAAGGEPVAKKLDFLCQELGREINTVGSKSTILEVNQAVIEVKDSLENIREQLRNVE